MAEKVFRVRTSVDRTSNSSTGDATLYTNLTILKSDLLDAYLDVLTATPTHVNPQRWQFARRWRGFRKQKPGISRNLVPQYPRVTKIQTVEQFINGEWVEIDHEFVDPDVTLIGVQ